MNSQKYFQIQYKSLSKINELILGDLNNDSKYKSNEALKFNKF